MRVVSTASKEHEVGFLSNISRFQLSSLITIASDLSRQLWEKQHPVAKLYRIDSSRFINGAYKPVGSTYLTPWNILDVVYHAVASSSDFAASVASHDDFFHLYNQFLLYDEENSVNRYDSLDSADKLFYILFGLTQKTFWFQERRSLLNAHIRFHRMLYDIPRSHSDIPKISQDIETKYGCSFPAYSATSMMLLWAATQGPEVVLPYRIPPSTSSKGVTNELARNLMDDYVSDYNSIRNGTLGARELYLTPILRTSSNQLLIPSVFLVARKAFTNIYWETRFLRRTLFHQELNQILGDVFEIYVDEVLDSYLRTDQFMRLKPSDRNKRADLVVFTDKYAIIVEQKFAMLNISLQDVEFDLEMVDRWLKSYVQAVRQLEQTATELDCGGRIAVKLILFFGGLYIADGLVKERVLRLASAGKEDKLELSNVFMIDIDDFESLMELVQADPSMAERVVDEKLQRQHAHDYSRGVEFSQIMTQMKLTPHGYLERITPSHLR